MCVAVSGEVLSITGSMARVSVRGNVVEVNISLVPAKVGDRVLVHAGCALQILPKEEAREMKALFEELMRAAHDQT